MHVNRRRLYEDAITAVCEEMIHLGIATRDEVQEIYSMFGNELIGLLPRQLPTKGEIDMAAKVTPSHRGLIIYKDTDVLPPDDYLKKVIAEYDTCCAQLVVDEGKVQTVLQDNKVPDLEELKESLSMFDKTALYLGKADSPYSDDDLPPYYIVDDHIACFIEGELPNFGHDQSQHSREFFAMNEYIIEKIRDVYEIQGDIDKTMKVLETGIFTKDIVNSVLKPNGCMVIVASNGIFQVLSIGMGWEMGGWWTSDRMAYVNDEPAKTEDTKTMSAAEKLRARLAAKGKKADPIIATSKPETSEKPSSETAIPKEPDRTVIIPTNFDVKKRAIWIRENFNLSLDKSGSPIMPEKWDTIKGLPYSQLKVNSPLRDHHRDLSKLNEAIKTASKGIATDIPTLVGSAQKTAIWADLLSKMTSDKLLDLQQIKAEEDVNIAWDNAFTTKDGKSYPLLLTLFWPTENYRKMTNTFSQAAICWESSVRNEIMNRWGKELVAELRTYLEDQANKKKDTKAA